MQKTTTRLLFFFTIMFLLLECRSSAQTGKVQGYVYDRATKEQVLLCQVFIKGTPFKTKTDINSYFSLDSIPIGKYTICIWDIGYDTLKAQILVSRGDNAKRSFYLKKVMQTLSADDPIYRTPAKKNNK
jgi:hypothetical protein